MESRGDKGKTGDWKIRRIAREQGFFIYMDGKIELISKYTFVYKIYKRITTHMVQGVYTFLSVLQKTRYKSDRRSLI